MLACVNLLFRLLLLCVPQFCFLFLAGAIDINVYVYSYQVSFVLYASLLTNLAAKLALANLHVILLLNPL